MLAVLKAGGAFVPLDPSHPVERLQGLCGSISARIVLCSRQHADLMAKFLDTVILIDDETIAELPLAKIGNASSVTSGNAAYVIFTSGSTGKPKVSQALKPLALPYT
jgi:non-ribosomal peptide synthetase component F